MELHHLGIACEDIEKSIVHVKKIYKVISTSEIVFDKHQQARLCIIETANGIRIELIAGTPVISLLKKGISYYHLCFEVDDIHAEIEHLKGEGAVLVSTPKPAILFKKRLVAFMYTHSGLIELLEKK